MSILLLFLDGVGLGDDDPAVNPFARGHTPVLRGLLDGPLVAGRALHRPGLVLCAADAALGVPGLPQSATGQTALLTGRNAPALVGRHVTAYPTAALRDLLARESLFAVLSRAGRAVALANAYSPEYFDALAARRLRMSAVTYAAQAAGVRLRGLDDLRAGRAVFHDLTRARLRQWTHDVPLVTPREAGAHLAAIAAGAAFTLFEFFLTDLAAHRRVPQSPDEVVAAVDDLLGGLLDARAPRTTVLVTSDHGNLEDDRGTAHTTYPVPVLAVGPAAPAFARVRAITDVAPAVCTALDLVPARAPA